MLFTGALATARIRWSASSALWVTPDASRISKTTKMNERGGNVATRASIWSNDRSLSQVKPAVRERQPLLLDRSGPKLFGWEAPSTTAMLVVAGALAGCPRSCRENQRLLQ